MRHANRDSDAYGSSPGPSHIGRADATTQITFQSNSNRRSGSIFNGYLRPSRDSIASAPSSARATEDGPAIKLGGEMMWGQTVVAKPAAMSKYIARSM
jgi:hypothetical protein